VKPEIDWRVANINNDIIIIIIIVNHGSISNDNDIDYYYGDWLKKWR